MNKQTARIYLDNGVKVYETLQKVMTEAEFKKITILNNRLVLCSDHLGEVAAFCLVGIALGMKVEYLIANSFFSPINISMKDMYKIEVNAGHYEIVGAGFMMVFDVVA